MLLPEGEPLTGVKAEGVVNALTVDLEDWYQGLEIDPEDWGRFEDRLAIGTLRLLDLLAEAGVRATFFVLGYAAERAPDLVRESQARGHELGTHGYGHRFVYRLGPEGVREDLKRSLEVLAKVGSGPIRGHRAPYFSITSGAEWAFEVLQECSIKFDSSGFPVKNYRYGIPDSPRWIHDVGDGLVEFPLPTYRLGKRNIPLAGGAYFRISPYTFTRFGLSKSNLTGHAAAFYIHPWELDPDHPRLSLARRIRIPHYWNLKATEGRLRRLMREFRFASMGEVLGLDA